MQARKGSSRHTVKEDATWRFDADGLEQRRMTEWQLDHLFDLRQLLPDAADVVVADFVQHRFFVFSLDRVALAVNHLSREMGCENNGVV